MKYAPEEERERERERKREERAHRNEMSISGRLKREMPRRRVYPVRRISGR